MIEGTYLFERIQGYVFLRLGDRRICRLPAVTAETTVLSAQQLWSAGKFSEYEAFCSGLALGAGVVDPPGVVAESAPLPGTARDEEGGGRQ